MKDITRRIGDRTFWLRAWGASPTQLLSNIVWKLRTFWSGAKYYDFPESPFWMRSMTGTNAVCYCPVGTITEFRFGFLGYGFWFEVRRGGPVRPCHCDKVIWLLYPDDHADEIEEYGLAKLQAEYPGVEAIR